MVKIIETFKKLLLFIGSVFFYSNSITNLFIMVCSSAPSPLLADLKLAELNFAEGNWSVKGF